MPSSHLILCHPLLLLPRECQIKTTMGFNFTLIDCQKSLQCVIRKFRQPCRLEKFSLNIINECVNFSNHLANYLAIPGETESVIALWFVIPLLQDALEEFLPMCPRRCVHSVHSSKIRNSEKKKKEINLNVRQREDGCEHTCVHVHARILYSTDLDWSVATAFMWNISESWYWARIANCRRAQRLWHSYEVLEQSKLRCRLLRHACIHSWQTYKDLYRNAKTVNSEWWLPGRREEEH